MKSKEEGIKEESDVFFATPGKRAQSLFYNVTCVGHFYYEDTYSLARENYNSLLVMYLIKGSAKVQCYGKTYFVKKDDIVLLNCYEAHEYAAIKDLETIWFHFDAKSGKELFEALYEVQGCIMEVRDVYSVKKNIQKIYDMHSSGKMVDEALQSAYIARIIADFFSNEGTQTCRTRMEIEESIQYIQNNYARNILVKELAKHVALSEYYFSRYFKKETGFTPHEYLTKTRVNQAKIVLKSTDKSLLEIAELCGLSNEASLIKTFKKYTGITPGRFRKTFL